MWLFLFCDFPTCICADDMCSQLCVFMPFGCVFPLLCAFWICLHVWLFLFCDFPACIVLAVRGSAFLYGIVLE